MSSKRRGGGLGAAFVLLIFIGAIVKFWAWIAAVLGAFLVFGLLLWLTFYLERRVDERYDKRAALVARADQQHAWVLAGDHRGIYGAYPPVVLPTRVTEHCPEPPGSWHSQAWQDSWGLQDS